MLQLGQMWGLKMWFFGCGFQRIVAYFPSSLSSDYGSHLPQSLSIMDDATVMIYFDGSGT
jgi:hypothetical protein